MSSESKEQPKAKPSFFKNGVDYDWQTTTAFNSLVKSFHDKSARPPRIPIKEAKKLLNVCLRQKLQPQLKKRDLCSDVLFAGSSYEGVKVKKSHGDNDLEFDVMVFIDVSDIEIEQTKMCGYVKLKPVGTTFKFPQFINEGYLQPDKVVNHFTSELKDCMKAVRIEAECDAVTPILDDVPMQDDDPLDDDTVQDTPANDSFMTSEHIKMFFKNINNPNFTKLHRHGPAVQMDVFEMKDSANFASKKNVGGKKKNENKLWFSVDIVPTLKIHSSGGNDPEYYVAKSTKMSKSTWRRSFSIQEKKKLKDLDGDQGCRKQVFRLLKVIRNKEPSLARITSYILKTVLFREIDKNEGVSQFWKSANLGQRLMDMIRRLQTELASNVVSHYYLDKLNLLEDQVTKIKPETIRQMSERFKCLNNSQKKMEKILKS